MYHRAFREIDLKAIEHNFDELSAKLRPTTKKCAVVKADAYGHGAVEVARQLEKKADYFAVASIGEGLELREKGIETPILVLGYTHPGDFRQLTESDITATVYSYADAILLSEAAAELNKKAKIHIAVDTGMSRIGFDTGEKAVAEIGKISLLPHIITEGIFSHPAKADFEDKTHTLEQMKIFDGFIERLEEKGISIPIKHFYNSASILSFPDKYDMVRMGVALYGINPFDHPVNTDFLKPAMQVKTHVIHIHEVEKGTGVGYGHLWVAEEKRKIATLSIGYADGLKRRLSNKGYLLINGKRAYITGRVCMDIVMVDVTDIPDVKLGDEAVLIGRSLGEEITAEEYGKMYGSFAYEVLSTFMPRVKKIYK